MSTMKRTIIALSLLLSCIGLSAQRFTESHADILPKTGLRPDRTVLLYPEGQGVDKGITENGVAVTLGPSEDNGLRGEETFEESGNRGNIGDQARMDIYRPAKCNGTLVIVAPGGGYSIVSSFNEGVYVAKWLNDHGYMAVVLKYRMPNGRQTVPLTDIQNAIRYCRHKAFSWGIDRIGVMGFSAGGHLAATAATMYPGALTRPDFAVLIYPRITLRRGESNGTKHGLLGKDETWAGKELEHERLLAYWSPETHVTTDTPPCFIALSADDRTVAPTNALPFYSELVSHKVPVELHVYPTGGHGWGFSYEKYKGEGRDNFAPYRADFESALLRWLDAQSL